MFRRSGKYRKSGFYGRYNKNTGTSELKFLDRTIPTLTVPIAGSVVNILPLLIPENTSPSGRIGRKIVVKSIGFRMHITLANSTLPDHDLLRIIILIDKQCNGAQPAVSDILQNANTATAFYNLQNSGRFEVIFNKYYNLFSRAGAGNTAGGLLYGGDTKFIHGYFKCNIPIEYNASTGAITEIRSNNIVMIAISTHADVAIGNDGQWRTRYYG